MLLVLCYALLPLVWVVINSTKTQVGLLSTAGLAFSEPFVLFSNIVETFTYNDGIYARWFLNTVLYVAVGAVGSTLISALGGYGLAKFRFRGKRVVFAVVLASIAIPSTALAIPLFLLFSQLGLTNTIWAVILPSMVSPFGLYLMWAFAQDAVPTELIEAARVDGAGELRIFRSVVVRLLAPGVVTVFLLTVAEVWNMYFLPLIVLNNPELYPINVGLGVWNAQTNQTGLEPIQNLVVTGAMLGVLPVVVIFLVFQRFWRADLMAGSLK